MLKFLSKVAANAAAVQKIKESDENKKSNFERVKKIQKLLGQADKKNPDTYTPFPNKMSSIGTSCSKLDDFLKDSEIKMNCKSAVLSIIQQIEELDPTFIASSLVNEIVDSSFKTATSRARNGPPLRLGTFGKTKNTWKERAIIMYFVLHAGLGGMDFKLAGKAFNTPSTTIRT